LHVSEHASVAPDPALGHRRIFGIELDQDGVAAETIGNESRGAGATKRVKDSASLGAASEDAGLDQGGRKRREMRLWQGFARNRPD
jgi:hypothetical protein